MEYCNCHFEVIGHRIVGSIARGPGLGIRGINYSKLCILLRLEGAEGVGVAMVLGCAQAFHVFRKGTKTSLMVAFMANLALKKALRGETKNILDVLDF